MSHHRRSGSLAIYRHHVREELLHVRREQTQGQQPSRRLVEVRQRQSRWI
jgi:hypothetical protein